MPYSMIQPHATLIVRISSLLLVAFIIGIGKKPFNGNSLVQSFSIPSSLSTNPINHEKCHHGHCHQRYMYYPSPFIIQQCTKPTLPFLFGSSSSTIDNDDDDERRRKKKESKKQGKIKLNHYELKTKLLRQFRDVTELSRISSSTSSSTMQHQKDVMDTSTRLTVLFKTIEKDILNTIWSCQSITEINDILNHTLHFAKKIRSIGTTKDVVDQKKLFANENHRCTSEHSFTDDDFRLLGPNIVSAMLRRILDLFEQKKKQQRYLKKKFKNRSSYGSSYDDRNDNKDLENLVIYQYIPTLLNITIQAYTMSNKDDQLLLPQQQQKNTQSIFDQQITHFSCVNALYSMSTILRNNNKSRLHDGINVSYLYQNLNDIVDNMSLLLLEPVTAINADETNKEKEGSEKEMLKTAKNETSMSTVSSSITTTTQLKLQGLAPRRLLEIIVSLATLVQCQNKHDMHFDKNPKSLLPSSLPIIMKSDTSLSSQSVSPQSTLIHVIGNRLHQGDAIGQFNGNDLSLGLWSLFILKSFHHDMIKSFMKRLRKKTVRETLNSNNICKSLWSIGQLMEMLNEVEGRELEMQRRQEQIAFENQNDANESFAHESSQEGIEEGEVLDDRWYEETSIELLNQISLDVDMINRVTLTLEETAIVFDQAEICCYTLLKELTSEGTVVGQEQEPFKRKKIQNLKERQIADILYTCVLLDMDKDDDVVRDLFAYLRQSSDFHSNYRISDIKRILWSMQRLNIRNETETISTLIDHFLHLKAEEIEDAIVPKTLITIIRSIVLILPDNGRNETQLLHELLPLLRNEAYLKKCNEFEVSNFMFVLAMTDQYDKKALIALARRMMEFEIVESSSPSSASRFLWSLSKLVSRENDYEMDELLFESFQALGGVLLSSQLTPVDASSAMWAIAKSSYSLDLGVFDHLAEMLAKDEMLERATIQQICFALWSCGKMINFEDPVREKMEHGQVTPPPYLSYATKYATFLVSVVDRMTAKDIAQTIWSLGKLKVADKNILNVLATRASEIALQGKFNSQELANIIWGLSKCDFDDDTLVNKLTSCMHSDDVALQSTPQEAANVLYALGRMMIYDTKTFAVMNDVIMRNLDSATTQTIANALWAHDRLDLTPPQQLFDNWAKEKLDLIGLFISESNNNNNEEMDK